MREKLHNKTLPRVYLATFLSTIALLGSSCGSSVKSSETNNNSVNTTTTTTIPPSKESTTTSSPTTSSNNSKFAPPPSSPLEDLINVQSTIYNTIMKDKSWKHQDVKYFCGQSGNYLDTQVQSNNGNEIVIGVLLNANDTAPYTQEWLGYSSTDLYSIDQFSLGVNVYPKGSNTYLSTHNGQESSTADNFDLELCFGPSKISAMGLAKDGSPEYTSTVDYGNLNVIISGVQNSITGVNNSNTLPYDSLILGTNYGTDVTIESVAQGQGQRYQNYYDPSLTDAVKWTDEFINNLGKAVSQLSQHNTYDSSSISGGGLTFAQAGGIISTVEDKNAPFPPSVMFGP